VKLAVAEHTDLLALSQSIDESLRRWYATTGLNAELTDVFVRSPDEPPSRVN
jgi:hypothetical protein